MKKRIILAVLIALTAIGGQLVLNAEDNQLNGAGEFDHICIPCPTETCLSLSKNSDGAYEISLTKDAMPI